MSEWEIVRDWHTGEILTRRFNENIEIRRVVKGFIDNSLLTIENDLYIDDVLIASTGHNIFGNVPRFPLKKLKEIGETYFYEGILDY